MMIQPFNNVIAQWFRWSWFRLFFILIIIYVAFKDKTIALLLTIAFVISLQLLYHNTIENKSLLKKTQDDDLDDANEIQLSKYKQVEMNGVVVDDPDEPDNEHQDDHQDGHQDDHQNEPKNEYQDGHQNGHQDNTQGCDEQDTIGKRLSEDNHVSTENNTQSINFQKYIDDISGNYVNDKNNMKLYENQKINDVEVNINEQFNDPLRDSNRIKQCIKNEELGLTDMDKKILKNPCVLNKM